MNSIEFANPEYFYLLLILVPLIVWYILKDRDAHASIQVSSIKSFNTAPKTYKYYLQFGYKLI